MSQSNVPTEAELEQFMQTLVEVHGQSPSVEWVRQTLIEAQKTAAALTKLGRDLAGAFKL